MARLKATSAGVIATASMPPVSPSKVSTGTVNRNYLPSGSVLQVVSKVNTSYSTATVDLGYWTTVPDMSLQIVPLRANSKFRIDIRWGGEVAGAWDVVFAISRNGAIIGTPTQEGSRMGAVGMPLQSYIDDDNNSTLEYSCFSYIDEPNLGQTLSVLPQTYSLVAKAWTSRTLYTGCVVNIGQDSSNYERISTEISITEIAT
jgi:hypothetical protein